MSAFKEALQQDLDKSRQAEIETLLAKAFFLSSQYDSVTFYGQKVISYCQEQDLSNVRIQRLLMENYNILGNKFGRVSDNSQAIHYYLEAFEHCKRSDKQRSLPDICTNIADTYYTNRRLCQRRQILSYRLALCRFFEVTPRRPFIYLSRFGSCLHRTA